jgi:hypothetical protein
MSNCRCCGNGKMYTKEWVKKMAKGFGQSNCKTCKLPTFVSEKAKQDKVDRKLGIN